MKCFVVSRNNLLNLIQTFSIRQVLNTADVLDLLKRRNLAEKFYLSAYRSLENRKSPEILAKLAKLKFLAGKYEDAYSFFREALKRHNDPKKQIEYCLMSIAKALEPLNPERYSDLVTFYFVSNASTKEIRAEQKKNFSDLIESILQDAGNKKILRPGFDLETLGEMIVGICVSTLLNWCVESEFPIVKKMKNAVKFINQSVFIEG